MNESEMVPEDMPYWRKELLVLADEVEKELETRGHRVKASPDEKGKGRR